MAKVKELREKRAAAATAAKAILEKAERETRDLTSQEANDFDLYHRTIEQLGDQIERADKQDRIDVELNRSQGVRAGRFDTESIDEIDPERRVLTPKQSFAKAIKADSVRSEISLPTFMRAALLGPRTDVERRAMGEATGAAGGFTVPLPLSAEFIDKLRAQTVVLRAGAVTVPMDSQTLYLARLAGDPTGAWRAENATVNASDATLERVTFTAQSYGFLVKVSRELFADSPNVGDILTNAFVQAAAREVDRVSLIGTGVAPEPLGIKNAANVGSVSMGTNGAALTNYDPFIDALLNIANSNAQPPSAIICAPRSINELGKLKDTTNQPLRVPPAIQNVPFLATTTVPINDTQGTSNLASRAYLGDFSQLMIGMREEVTIEALRERYSDNAQIAFWAHLRLDIQLAHPQSFCQIIGIN